MLTFTRDYAAQVRTASSTNILLGIWLLFSPWVFDYHTWPALLNSVIVGALIVALAANRFESPGRKMALSWINLVLGLWTIASPWVCGYASNISALRNNVVLGIVIGAFAIWSATATIAWQKHPGGTPAH